LRPLLALLFLLTACGFQTHRSPIRVTLTATSHHPLVSLTGRNHQPPPSQQWGYCVKIRTAAGKTVPAPIQLRLQILSGRTPVEGVGLVSLHTGYDNWCGSIGGEYNALEGAARYGKRLVFQAVVKAMGITVTRDWPIVVRVVR
jgi:hypothetical protein